MHHVTTWQAQRWQRAMARGQQDRRSQWVLRVVVDGKRREMGLGSLPDASLKQARVKADVARSKAAEGVDPVQARHQVELKVPTFTSAAASIHPSAPSELGKLETSTPVGQAR